MSGVAFAKCYRCGLTFEDVDTIVESGDGWCPTCDRPALREAP